MNGRSTDDSFDIEYHLEAFDKSWHLGNVPDIDDFLTFQTSESDVNARQWLLFELVMIDQEYRWRMRDTYAAEISVSENCATIAGSDLPDRPCLEDYVCRYPELGVIEQLPRQLLLNEYRILQRWGDRTKPEDYLARFPLHSDRLRAELTQIATQFANYHVNRLRISCPHCHATIELADGSLSDVSCPCCSGSFNLLSKGVEPASARERRLGRFELVETIGAGSFGTVWKARDPELKRDVAIKVPRREQLTVEETEQFLCEARAAAQLRHPNIVTVYEVGRDGDTLYIVSDHVRGVTLANWLVDQRLNSRAAAELCRQSSRRLRPRPSSRSDTPRSEAQQYHARSWRRAAHHGLWTRPTRRWRGDHDGRRQSDRHTGLHVARASPRGSSQCGSPIRHLFPRRHLIRVAYG